MSEPAFHLVKDFWVAFDIHEASAALSYFSKKDVLCVDLENGKNKKVGTLAEAAMFFNPELFGRMMSIPELPASEATSIPEGCKGCGKEFDANNEGSFHHFIDPPVMRGTWCTECARQMGRILTSYTP